MSDDSDSEREGIRFTTGGSDSDSDDDPASPVVAAGLMLGMLAAHGVRAVTRRRAAPPRRHRRRRSAAAAVAREPAAAPGRVVDHRAAPLPRDADDPRESVTASSGRPRGTHDAAARSGADGWSEVTLEEVASAGSSSSEGLSEDRVEWKDEQSDDAAPVDATSSNESECAPEPRTRKTRALSVSAEPLEKVSSSVYSRMRMKSFTEVEIELTGRSQASGRNHQPWSSKLSWAHKGGSGKARRMKLNHDPRPLTEQCHWDGTSKEPAVAPPSHILRLKHRTPWSSGLADLFKP